MNRNDFNPELREGTDRQDAIGLIELCSVARGIETTDQLLKDAHVDVLFATPVQPGKYVVLFTGAVQDVQSSLRGGGEVAGTDRVDELMIPQVHPQILPTLERKGGQVKGQLDAIGVIETTTVASAILSCDAALKTATVDLLDLRIANGLGGKSFFTITGEVSDVRSATAKASEVAQAGGHLTREVVVPRPHPDLTHHLL